MKLLLCFLLLPMIASAIIYDQDDRHEAFEIYDNLEFSRPNVEGVTSLDPMFVEKAINATAAMIHPRKLFAQDGGEFLIKGSQLSRHRFYSTKKYLCEDVRFIEQESAATCSGFLISPNHIMTAGHCIENMDDCSNYHWVFNYKFAPGYEEILVGSDDIYNCVSISGRRRNGGRNIDWAIIKLDRKVVGRQPLRTRGRTYMEYQEDGMTKKSQLKRKVPLFLVGFPFGTPMKVTTNGQVTKTGLSHAFQSTIDNFFGNSGGPVLNAKTGYVEGLVAHLGVGAWGLTNGGMDASGEKACLKPRFFNTSKSIPDGYLLQSCRTTAEGVSDTFRKEKIPR